MYELLQESNMTNLEHKLSGHRKTGGLSPSFDSVVRCLGDVMPQENFMG